MNFGNRQRLVVFNKINALWIPNVMSNKTTVMLQQQQFLFIVAEIKVFSI